MPPDELGRLAEIHRCRTPADRRTLASTLGACLMLGPRALDTDALRRGLCGPDAFSTVDERAAGVLNGSAMTLQIRALHPTIGAEITGIDLRRQPDSSALEEIVDAWRRYAVVVFREQNLQPDQQLSFSRLLGTLDPAPTFDTVRSALNGYPEVAVVSNIKVDGVPIGGLGAGELAWHADMTFVPSPPVACVLHARELPDDGGDTLFLDLRAARTALPAALEREVREIKLLHDRAYTSAGTPRIGAKAGDGTWHQASVIDPVSGRDVLFLGRRRNSQAQQSDGTDAAMLLEQLWSIADQPAHIFHQVWKRGDMVLWNNVATMHRRDAFDDTARRLLHRTQIRRLHAQWEAVPWQLSA
jgi:taurine dioxygenase